MIVRALSQILGFTGIYSSRDTQSLCRFFVEYSALKSQLPRHIEKYVVGYTVLVEQFSVPI